MNDSVTLRYRSLAITVPNADIQLALQKLTKEPEARGEKLEHVKEWLAKNYRRTLNNRLSRTDRVFFGVGVALLQADEILKGRESYV